MDFVPLKRCNCGLQYDDHVDEAKQNPKEFPINEWEPNEVDILTKNDGLTDAFGEILFLNHTDEDDDDDASNVFVFFSSN